MRERAVTVWAAGTEKPDLIKVLFLDRIGEFFHNRIENVSMEAFEIREFVGLHMVEDDPDSISLCSAEFVLRYDFHLFYAVGECHQSHNCEHDADCDELFHGFVPHVMLAQNFIVLDVTSSGYEARDC